MFLRAHRTNASPVRNKLYYPSHSSLPRGILTCRGHPVRWATSIKREWMTPANESAATTLNVAPIAVPAAFSEMIAAVNDEIDAVRRQSRANMLSVSNGSRVSVSTSGAVYHFTVRRGLALRDDSRAACDLDGEKLDGVVLSARGGDLVLSVPRDLGPAITVGSLVIGNLWLLTALVDRLRELSAI